MTSEQITVNQVVVGLLENVGRQIKRATDEATDEQLYYRPSADANHIAWLAWHLCRWQDHMTASISGDLQVWQTGGWAERFGLSRRRVGHLVTQVTVGSNGHVSEKEVA